MLEIYCKQNFNSQSMHPAACIGCKHTIFWFYAEISPTRLIFDVDYDACNFLACFKNKKVQHANVYADTKIPRGFREKKLPSMWMSGSLCQGQKFEGANLVDYNYLFDLISSFSVLILLIFYVKVFIKV